MKSFVVPAALFLALLHQDFWNWDRADLALGFLPAGLAYHVAYTLVVVCFWLVVVNFAWPSEVEEFAESSGEAGEGSGADR
jgi:hypothetical protein